jgi:hypothetical protein
MANQETLGEQLSLGAAPSVFIGSITGGNVTINTGSPLRAFETIESTPPATLAGKQSDHSKPPHPETEVSDQPEATEVSDEDMDRYERLAKLSQADRSKGHTRRNYLRALIKDFGKQRKTEGLETQHEKEPKDRDALEAANEKYQLNSEAQLKRACNVCVHAGNCALNNNIERWYTTHPYSRSDRKRPYHWELPFIPKIVEGRMKFFKRLEKNPFAHCMPERDNIASTKKAV